METDIADGDVCRLHYRQAGDEMRVFSATKVLAYSTLAISVAYFLSYAIVTLLFDPIQDRIFPSLQNAASLLFLPSGVKLFAIIICSEYSLLALFGAGFLCNYLYLGMHNVVDVLGLSVVRGSVAQIP